MLLNLEKEIAVPHKNEKECKQKTHTNFQHNLDLPISRLPVHIMADIFGHCIPFRHSDPKATSVGWLAFSHVCRLWRSIALNDGKLWTYIHVNNHHLAETMLERSKAAPLDVRMPWTWNPDRLDTKRLLEKLRHQLFRIQHLQLFAYNNNTEFFHALVQPAPSLHSLEVVGNVTNVLLLPDDFLARNAPLLTSLRLRHTYLPWNSPLLTRLTALDLSGDGVTNIPTARQLLQVLRVLTRLEFLRLAYILPNFIERTEEVRFSVLRELTIAGNIGGCEGLLNNISFPETTVLDIRCDIEPEDVDPFLSFISHFPRIFLANHSSTEIDPQAERPRIMKTLLIDLKDSTLVSLKAWNIDLIPVDALESHRRFTYSGRIPMVAPSIHLSFEWSPQQPFPDIELDMEWIFSSLHMGHVQMLHITGDANVNGSPDFLVRCLASLPFNSTGTKTIVVHGGGFSDQFTQVFALLSSIDTSGSPPILAFPALHTLALLCLDASCWSHPAYSDGQSTFLDLLLEMLKFRSQNGQKVEVLMARGYNSLGQEDAALLNELVGELRNIR
ncbi:hypothetical protein VNI00_004557 [Paramarasmius palmivorus]|uniref:F-box domain-containing protein n=1 Tax=Paramarasmius palmivorus TaxID=297713 RepID=A0AAW0DJB5_9AGAR